MTWVFERFKGDAAIYAFCPKCSFHYTAGGFGEINLQYKCCPMCCEYLYEDKDSHSVIWQERDIMDMYEFGWSVYSDTKE